MSSTLRSGMTLQAIGLTLGGGLCISTLAVLAFGVAVMFHNTIIATRCTRRHPNTFWRSRRDIDRERRGKAKGAGVSGADGVGLKHRESDAAVSPPGGDERHVQDRGNPFVGWIPWTLRMSYNRMLNGIPGTGTRDGGMGGKLLDVNLDAVVLFRYHGKGLKPEGGNSFPDDRIDFPDSVSLSHEWQIKLDPGFAKRLAIPNSAVPEGDGRDVPPLHRDHPPPEHDRVLRRHTQLQREPHQLRPDHDGQCELQPDRPGQPGHGGVGVRALERAGCPVQHLLDRLR